MGAAENIQVHDLVPAIVAHSLSDFGETGLEFLLGGLLP